MPKTKTTRYNQFRFQTMATESGIPHGSATLNPAAPVFQALNAAQPEFTVQQMEEIIKKIVKETLESNQTTEFIDETIRDADNLSDLDKVPDIVKAIRDFDGNPAEYTAWRKSADRIFSLYETLRGTAKYYGILLLIRSKITGQANTALESYNTALNWEAIKQCLNTHYADKRDISTLEYQLTTLIQGKDTIEYFYQKVYTNFSLILNNISGMGLNKYTENTLIETYRNKALDTFIRGLNGDLPRLLAIREPKTLPEALYVCTKLANQDYRTNYAYNNQKTIPPPRPPKAFMQQYNRQPINNTGQQNFNYQQRTFSPHISNSSIHRPQIHNTPSTYRPTLQQLQPMQTHPQTIRFQQYPPKQYRPGTLQSQQPMRFNPMQQATMADTQPPAEPMDVDRSIRSQQINYANRPNQQQLAKRPLSTQFNNQQPKQSRNFHISMNEINNSNTFETEEMPYATPYETQSEIPWEEYSETYEQQDWEPTYNHETPEIHFLE